jgi:tetratricopeptide (TPR) repeat protein
MTDFPSAETAAEAACLATLAQSGDVCEALLALSAIRTEQHRLVDAVALARAVLAIHPDFAGAHAALGYAHAAAAEPLAAAEALQRAVALDPQDMRLRIKLARTWLVLNRHAEVLETMSALPAVSPIPLPQMAQWLTEAYCVRGRALLALRQPVEALKAFDLGAGLDSGSSEPLLGRGMALLAFGRAAGALQPLHRAFEINPNDPEAPNELGLALGRLGQYAEAVRWFETALQIDRHFAPAYRYMGSALAVLRMEKEALTCLREARRIRPEWEEVWLDEAGVLLRAGRLQEGWKAYEWRESARYMMKISAPAYWTGDERLEGKSILLSAEQGLGDTLHFVRYAPLIAAMGAQVTLVVQRPLMPLLEPHASAWGVTIIAQGEPIPFTDLQVLLLSLPYACGTRLDTIPAHTRYLSTPEAYRDKWRDALPQSGKMRVGIVASGNPHYRDDAYRTIGLQQLVPVLDLAAIDWVWLQPQTRESEREVLAQYPGVNLIGETFTDFADTAAVLEQLDLIITVDTAVAHLAGAMGRPVWILLPFVPDWRWMLDRDDSPWYPSVRLFRQRRPHDWSDVVQDVVGALSERVAGYAASIDA